MRILLHIGQSKTGTSAIQAYLTLVCDSARTASLFRSNWPLRRSEAALNRERLRQAGILYPGVTICGMPVDLGSHNWVADALIGLSRYPHLTAKQYFDRFFSDAEQVEVKMMILSGEHFFGGEPRIWDVSNENTFFGRYRNKVDALAWYLAGHEVAVLVYLRPQVEGLRPGDIMVVPYEHDLLHKKSTVADFLHRTGLDYLDLPFGDADLRVNRSLSWEHVEVKKSPLSSLAWNVCRPGTSILYLTGSPMSCLGRLSILSHTRTPGSMIVMSKAALN